MNLDTTNFGKRLDECMKKSGYSNKKLTDELEISKNAIGNYKNNQIPNATILFQISQKIGTSMEYLLTGEVTKDIFELTDNEKELLNEFAYLPEREQIKFIGKLEDEAKKYKVLEKTKSLSSKTG